MEVNSQKQKVIVVLGPTAVGKSDFAVSLALHLHGEIISADSRQVYKGLDIGTGKITIEEMRGVTHHLLDVKAPMSQYTVAEYVADGRHAIDSIASRHALPIICGGTGFYIDALLGRVTIPDVPPNDTLRSILQAKPLEELQGMLRTQDPRRASTIDMNNRVRIIRALEIIHEIGFVPPLEPTYLYNVCYIGLTLPQHVLDEKIAARVHARMKLGMLDEARRLHAEGLSRERMHELGLEYAFLADVLQGTMKEADMIPLLISAIRQYSKRQMTWFKKNTEVHWLNPTELSSIEKALLLCGR